MNISEAILAYCDAKDIQVICKPSGAVRFLGRGIDRTYAPGECPKLTDFQPYEPRKGHALRNI